MKFHKLAATALAVVFTGAMAGGAMAASVSNTVYGTDAMSQFSDIGANTLIAQSIGVVTQDGLMSGEANGTFAPNQEATIGDLAQALVGYLGMQSAVAAGSGQAGDVTEAKSLGLLSSGATASAPLLRITAAVAIANALKLAAATGKLPWSDGSSIPSSDQGLLLSLYNKGYFMGYSGGAFNPDTVMTREQLALVFARLLGL